MVKREDLVQGKQYRVTGNKSGHMFEIGEIVTFNGFDLRDDELVCDKLDKSDYWYMYTNELEEV